MAIIKGVVNKGLEFTYMSETWGEQEAKLSENYWGDIKVGTVCRFDSFFTKPCKVIKVFEEKSPRYGWFIAKEVDIKEENS